MRSRLKAAIVAAAAVAVTGAALGPASAFERRDGQKILVTAQRQAVPIMDPSIKYDASIRTMQQAMYDALLKYVDTPPRVVPWLAESYDVSDDGLSDACVPLGADKSTDVQRGARCAVMHENFLLANEGRPGIRPMRLSWAENFSAGSRAGHWYSRSRRQTGAHCPRVRRP